MRSETGLSIRAIGRKYEVAYSTARKIINREAWAHID